MATKRTVYVDPDVSGGAGNGTSWANAYSSLNAAEQAEDDTGNLVSRDEYIEFHCGHNGASQTTADTAAVTFDPWTPDATRYIEVLTEPADRHSGVWSTTKYRLDVTNAKAILNYENDVRLTGLQIKTSTGSADYQQTVDCQEGPVWISACIIRGHGNASYQQSPLTLAAGSKAFKVWNCIIYGVPNLNGNTAAIEIACNTCDVYSCTFVSNGAYCVWVKSGTVVVKNCYAYVTAGRNAAYYGTMTQTTCAASDTSADGTALDSIALNTTNFTNVTAGSEDFRPPVGSGLIGVGTDTSGDSAPLNFTVDIAGTTRS